MRRRIWKSPPFPADFPMMVPPSERASAEALENIHPFADNNGRTGRQILNMMLMQAGYEPIAIRHDAGSTYAGRLEQWQAYGNPVPPGVHGRGLRGPGTVPDREDRVRYPPRASHRRTRQRYT